MQSDFHCHLVGNFTSHRGSLMPALASSPQLHAYRRIPHRWHIYCSSERTCQSVMWTASGPLLAVSRGGSEARLGVLALMTTPRSAVAPVVYFELWWRTCQGQDRKRSASLTESSMSTSNTQRWIGLDLL